MPEIWKPWYRGIHGAVLVGIGFILVLPLLPFVLMAAAAAKLLDTGLLFMKKQVTSCHACKRDLAKSKLMPCIVCTDCATRARMSMAADGPAAGPVPPAPKHTHDGTPVH